MGRAARGSGWDRRGILAVVARDLRVVRGSKPVILPMLIVPLLLLVVLPAGVVISARLGAAAIDLAELEPMLELLPDDITAQVVADPTAGIIEVALVYLVSPLLLIVPLMTASVIAADSIAGERERKTLEGLLLTPLTDRELFVAKLLGAWLPAVAVGIGGGVLYAVVAEVAAIGAVDGLLFPNVLWLALIAWLGPALAAISLGATVVVSARVKTVQEAFQIAGIVVLPVVVLIAGQAAGLLALSTGLVLAAGAVSWVIAVLVLRAGMSAVSRTRLGERL
ncbi:MAG: ABC transporter permease subunit [Nitriliruptoraceae bacterium]